MAITICHKCETRFDLDQHSECPKCLEPLPNIEIKTNPCAEIDLPAFLPRPRPSIPSQVQWDDPLDD